MKKSLFILIISTLFISIASAQEETKEDVTPESQDFARFQLAMSMARYGYDTYSPTALLEAATILDNVPIQPLKYESYTQEGGSGDKNAEEARPFTVQQLLEDAKEYADGDEVVLEMISRITPRESHRGRAGGVGSISTSITSLTTDVYTIKYEGKNSAKVAITGNGLADLDLYVYDKDGELMGKATDATDACVVSWHPKSDEIFTIKIKNISSSNNSYTMITN